jgi:hypothetical protein
MAGAEGGDVPGACPGHAELLGMAAAGHEQAVSAIGLSLLSARIEAILQPK